MRDIKEIYEEIEEHLNHTVVLCGWIRNHRKQKKMGFIDLFDGTCFNSIQILYDVNIAQYDEIVTFHVGSALKVEGVLVENKENNKISYEISASKIELIGNCLETYPLQPKKHSIEFLRENAHLRPRTRVFQAVFRIRSIAAKAIHEYFQMHNYVYVHTPLITSNDAEGAGNTFTVTTLDQNTSKKDYTEDFFGKHTSLAVTGQLEAETFAMAFKKVYTFGPTFRAENSNTKTHMAEFWMVEPEIAFCNLGQLMDIQEEFLKYIVKQVAAQAPQELQFLEKYNNIPLHERLEHIINTKIVRVTYKEAIEILKGSNQQFEFVPEYGEDLAREHEKYLTQEHFKAPVFVYNWPKDIKAFYMYQNDDNQTVAAVDLLVPGSGELMGGSQREVREELLFNRMKELNISTDEMYWYLDLRRYGGCEHSGFGMGFERLLIYLTGMENIRDVIPYPRTPNNCEF